MNSWTPQPRLAGDENVATAEGRGNEYEIDEPRSGERFFRRSAALATTPVKTTAFSRG
jgi:hypothetical protein